MIVTNDKERIRALLESTNREGMDGLIGWLLTQGFFEAPASTKFHGCYEGGLAKHSLGVYDHLLAMIKGMTLDAVDFNGQKPLEITKDTVIIAALLHDVCKVNQYLGTEKPYKWNGKNPEGHAKLSIARIKEHIELTDLEEMMIRYHMGIYGLVEYGEYHLLGDYTDCPFDKKTQKEERQKWGYGRSLRNAWYHNPIVKQMYFADERATLEEKALEV